MIVSANERREVLKLFNVSEAARLVGVDIQRLHRDVKSGVVSQSAVRIQLRSYYTESDLGKLSSHYEKE